MVAHNLFFFIHMCMCMCDLKFVIVFHRKKKPMKGTKRKGGTGLLEQREEKLVENRRMSQRKPKSFLSWTCNVVVACCQVLACFFCVCLLKLWL